jgi:Flp pilus assembly protein TadB
MTNTLFLMLFITSAAALFCLGAATLAPSSVLGTRLRTLSGLRTEGHPRKEKLTERFEEHVLDPLAKAVPKSPEEVSRSRRLLITAGYREDRHLAIYFGLRVLMAIVFSVVIAASTLGLRSPVALVASALMGYVLPRFVLKRMVKHRQHAIWQSSALRPGWD